MPLNLHDMVMATVRATARRDDVMIVGAYSSERNPYTVSVGKAINVRVGSAHNYAAESPEGVLRLMFDKLLQAGYYAGADFVPTSKRPVVYRVRKDKTDSTIPWLGVFRTTKYLRVPFPDGIEPPNDRPYMAPEFLVSFSGSKNSVEEVIGKLTGEYLP